MSKFPHSQWQFVLGEPPPCPPPPTFYTSSRLSFIFRVYTATVPGWLVPSWSNKGINMQYTSDKVPATGRNLCMKTLRRSYQAYAKDAVAATKAENFQLAEELKLSERKANTGAKAKTLFITGTIRTQDLNTTLAQQAPTINEQPRVNRTTHKTEQMNGKRSSTHPAIAMKPKEDTTQLPEEPETLKLSRAKPHQDKLLLSVMEQEPQPPQHSKKLQSQNKKIPQQPPLPGN